ncbi:hypothetical protein SCHPADRAFT_920699 [Schizopora paradoxa]|uniref:Large ribosomal subunit protein mL59 domain-containing protein n=1 Tax=Schizopora paradoxa TaxID=27342 RepID=A0A0H2RRD8_9AGAM|nr:hypothetical protein SCHPADRAFT_920699 [Schizopora paradoxa]
MATVLPKILRDFRARELSKILPSAAQLNAAGAATQTSSTGSTRISNPFLPWCNPKTGRWAPPLYSRRRQKELVKAARSVELESGSLANRGIGAIGLLPPGSKCNAKKVEEGKLVWKEVVESAARANAAPSVAESITEASTAGPSSSESLQPPASAILRSADVEWVGRLRPVDEGAPTSVTSRLYSNKKRMFKGHKWERAMESRKRMIRVRMRDMKDRVERFKNHYRRRRPNPLRPPATRKRESLPF